MLKRWSLGCLAAVVLAGCADESPVGLDPIVPPGVVRSFEIVLDADRFLVMDTSITGFSTAAGSGYGVVANAHAGVLNAHTLLRAALPLRSVTYRDTAGVAKNDTLPIIIGGELILKLDTLQGRASGPVSLALYRIAEEWDPRSVTWSLRVDTGDVSLPWSTPGGTRGEFVARADLFDDTTEVGIPVDSATLALWSDTLNASRGGLIVSETPGSRLRFNEFHLVVHARPSARPDTVVMDTVQLNGLTFVYDPVPTYDGAMYVGGTPNWRSYLRLRERLDTLTFEMPCEDGETCTFRLGDANINYAGLVFTPVTPPAGFAPDDTARIVFYRVLGGGTVPLARAPIAPVGSDLMSQLLVPPASFASGEAAEVGFTKLLRNLLAAMASNQDVTPITLAMLDATSGKKFGIAAFAPIDAGDAAPRLRLIVSVIDQDRIR
jgi:hypothetical protein